MSRKKSRLSCIDQIKNHLDNSKNNSLYPTNLWFQDRDMKVYIRFDARHFIEGLGIVKTLDIASIEVSESKRGTGIFTKFLSNIIGIISCETIYIENVFETRFAKFFEKNGWTLIEKDKRYNNDEPLCLYRKVEITK